MSKQSFNKILITGFEPFDQDLTNPSQDLLSFMQNQNMPFEMETYCLPVTFLNSYELLADQINSFKPDFILMTGLAKNRQKISLEKIAINWIDARIPDNHGHIPAIKKISEHLDDGIFTQLDLNTLLEKLDKTKFEISFSAGAFVCNFLYFKILSDVKIPALFVHLPMPSSEVEKNDLFHSIANLILHL